MHVATHLNAAERERERERGEKDRQTDRQTDRQCVCEGENERVDQACCYTCEYVTHE